jgi:phage baseplate assembly protein V
MFRVGIVQTQDVQNARVRVTFAERNQLVSWWLPVLRWGSQNDKDFWIPDIGEQVVCLMDDHDEDGAVLGTIFSEVDQPQSGMTADKRNLTAKDSAVFEYDRSKHTLTVTIPANGTINVTVNGGNINLSVPQGDVTFKTSEHNDSVNKMIDTYNSHVHQFTDSHGDTGPTQTPSQQMP